MNTERKLATILATDCVNFSKHKEEGEELTLSNLNECRKIIDEIIANYGGKIFSTAGDSVVAEFASPVQCVKAAVEFQDKLYERNEHSLTKLPLSWRVGIHVDDVIVENNNIMGSGVNIAARLESQSEPGKILVSKIVKDQVDKRIDYSIEADGTRKLKNISDEFEVFKVKGLKIDEDDFFSEEVNEENNEDENNKKDDNVIISRNSSQPKIAILTFKNVSKNDDSEFLVEAITGDLIIEFSRLKEFDVVSKKTCDDHDKSNEDALTFAKKHKIDFLVGGNIRSAGNRLRVAVDLTNAKDGSIIWGDRYDRVLEDIFDIQDEIVQKISKELLGNIEITNLQNIKRKPTDNLNSYENLVIGRYHWLRQSSAKEHNDKALFHFDKALEQDETNARAHSLKACTIGGGLGKQYYEDNDKMMKMIFHHIEKSLEHDENDYEVRRISSAISLMQKKYDESEEHGKIAYSMNPNDPRVLAVYGEILVRNKKIDQGLELLHKALELDPVPAGQKTSDNRYRDLVLGYFCKKDYDICITQAQKIKELEPRSWVFLLYSLKEKDNEINLKENEYFINKYDDFSKLDWKDTIKGFHLPDEEMNKNLENFTNQVIN